MYEHILVAVDFSEISEKCLLRGKQFAKELNAELNVCYVLKVMNFMNASPYSMIPQFDFEKTVEIPLKEKFVALCKKHEVEDHCQHFITGEPKTEIVRLGSQIGSCLIIVGGHDHSWLGALGSVAAAVVNQSSCDVLIVK